ncbi:MAG: fluoride efflux transporter CrcB [Phycisphaerae bacterium]
MLLEFLVVGLAGSLGAMLRLAVARIFTWSAFPIGTLLINLSGSMFLGWFLTVISDRYVVSEAIRLAIAVGFVGAYTTFSTYMYESDRMLQDGAGIRATLYLVGSVVLGLVAVRAGIILGRRF